jgi:hypothetical protein
MMRLLVSRSLVRSMFPLGPFDLAQHHFGCFYMVIGLRDLRWINSRQAGSDRQNGSPT